MNEIVSTAKAEIENCKNTGEIRRLSAKLFKNVKNETGDCIFSICGELLEQHNWGVGVIAFDFAYRIRKQYSEKTFYLFEEWLEKYVRGWGDCDDFCTHAFGELICQNPILTKNIIAWTGREEFWMRRAAAVVLIPSIWKNKYQETNPLHISDVLMSDDHDLVRKGYGWMLKILSLKEPQIVFDYLIKNKEVMPRVSYRYAMEKMDADRKRIILR